MTGNSQCDDADFVVAGAERVQAEPERRTPAELHERNKRGFA
jgi:hypothetical protein